MQTSNIGKSRSRQAREIGLATMLASTSAWALLLGATPASAQSPSSAAEAADAQSVGIGDIVVTANRRAQKLQDVPIAINAISGELAEAQGITGTASLQNAVPSLQLPRQGGQANFYMRGLGSANGLPNAENSVALYIDGAYMPAPFANFFEFNNVERVEVLKGPQGTLFGRNASGGVIQIITKDPEHTPTGKFEIGYGNYDTFTGNAYLSGGLSDDLAAGIAVRYSNQDKGWGTNLDTGKRQPGNEDIAVRGKILWTPGDSTEVRLAADYLHSDIFLAFPILEGAANVLGQPYFGNYNSRGDTDQQIIRSKGISLTIDHDFGAAQLKSISAYRKTTGSWSVDLDASAVNFLKAKIFQFGKMFTQEVHLLSPSDSKLQWLLGAFYFNYNAGQNPQQTRGELLDPAGFGVGCIPTVTCNPDSGIDLFGSTKSISKAIFAQGTYPLAESTNVTLGGRYTWDKVTYNGVTFAAGTNFDLFGPGTATKKKGTPTWRVSLDHKFTPDIMGYVSYNRGAKAGGFSLGAADPAANVNNPFASEKVDAYEVGLKAELADRRIRLDLSGFYYDFANIQLQRLLGGQAFVFNGPKAKMYGGEVDAQAQVTDNFVINAAIGLLHTEIGDFPEAALQNSCRTATGGNDSGGFFCDPVTGLATTVPFNARGNDLPNAPKFTGNLGFTYTIPSEVGTFALSANGYYNNGSFAEIDNRLKYKSYALLNASLLWTSTSDSVTVRIWGKNLTNKFHWAQRAATQDLFDVGFAAPPRQYGVALGYKF